MLQAHKTMNAPKNHLYLIGTPIGNYDDMTFRAINTLKEVDVIYCEDTRITGQLLKHFDISKPMVSYNIVTENDKTDMLLNDIRNGKTVAVVSDAGMPSISDPGLKSAMEAVKEDIYVEVIPGVSAGITALCGSTMPTNHFYFYGFLNSKSSKRVEQLKEIVDFKDTIIFYEAPHRILETLEDLLKVFGNRNIVVARELTKHYEEYLRGTIKEVLEVVDQIKGEIVIIVEGCKLDSVTENLNNLTIKEHFNFYFNSGMNKKDAMKKVAKDRGVPNNVIYDELFIKGKDN